MSQAIEIRPVREEDIQQVVSLSRSVQWDMAVDILRHHVHFLAHHVWPYVLTLAVVVAAKLFSSLSVYESVAVGVLLTAVEETARLLFFVSKWADIFYVGDDVKTVVQTFTAPKRFFLVAVRGGKVVGMVGVREQPTPTTGDVTTAEMCRMFVHNTCTGTGLGSRLMKTALEESRNLGYRAMELLTHHTNGGAIRFYERFGFRHFNTIHYAAVYPYVYDQYEYVLELS